jgi:DNA topoisomerase-1
METVGMPQALELLSLPKVLGIKPGIDKEIKAGIGRFGPYVVCDGDYRSIPKGESIFAVTLARALELFAIPKKGRGRAAPLKELGVHPVTNEAVQIMNGPYGPYIKTGKVNVSLPEDAKPEDVTLAQAVELLSDKIKPAKAAKKAKKPQTKEVAATKVLTKVVKKKPAKSNQLQK